MLERSDVNTPRHLFVHLAIIQLKALQVFRIIVRVDVLLIIFFTKDIYTYVCVYDRHFCRALSVDKYR